jgi:tetratricopeptide (TPR) repeat protein
MLTDLKKSLEFAVDAKNLAVDTQNPLLRIKADYKLSGIYFFHGLYEESITCNSDVLREAEKIKNYEWIGKSYYNFGRIRLVMEDYLLAEEHFNESKKFFTLHYGNEDAMDDEIRVSLFNNLGVIYSGLGRIEAAKNEFESGIAFAKGKARFKVVYVQLLNNLGDVYFKQANYEASIELYLLAKQEMEGSSNLLLTAMLNNSLGKAYLEKGLVTESLSVFKEGYALANKANGYSHLKHIASGISRAYSYNSQPDSALIFLQLSQAFADSLNLKKASETILKEELLTEFSAKESRLHEFYMKNRLPLLAAIFILVIGVVYLFFRNKIAIGTLRKIEYSVEEQKKENVFLSRKVEESQKELTVASLNSIRSKELVDKFKKTLQNSNSLVQTNIKYDLEKLINELKEGKTHNSLGDFEYHFSRIYIGFFEKVIQHFPDLTLNERRLCSFMKLQLTTKEITAITGQSVRAVEIARSRLRKKLNLTNSDISLYDFFIDF